MREVEEVEVEGLFTKLVNRLLFERVREVVLMRVVFGASVGR